MQNHKPNKRPSITDLFCQLHYDSPDTGIFQSWIQMIQQAEHLKSLQLLIKVADEMNEWYPDWMIPGAVIDDAKDYEVVQEIASRLDNIITMTKEYGLGFPIMVLIEPGRIDIRGVGARKDKALSFDGQPKPPALKLIGKGTSAK